MLHHRGRGGRGVVPNVSVEQLAARYHGFVVSARDGKVDELKRRLAEGQDANCRTVGARTALIEACANGLEPIVRILLEVEGLALDAQDADGLSALHCAAVAQGDERLAIVKVLLGQWRWGWCVGRCTRARRWNSGGREGGREGERERGRDESNRRATAPAIESNRRATTQPYRPQLNPIFQTLARTRSSSRKCLARRQRKLPGAWATTRSLTLSVTGTLRHL